MWVIEKRLPDPVRTKREPSRCRRAPLSLLFAATILGLPLAAQELFPDLPEPPDVAEAVARDLAPPEPVPGAIAIIMREAASPVLRLPDLPDIAVSFAPADIEPAPAAEITRTDGRNEPVPDIAIILPEPPAIALSDDLQAQSATGSIARQATPDILDLDLPEPPAVTVSLEPSSGVAPEAFARLDLDADRLRTLVEPYRGRFRLKVTEVESFVETYIARDFRPIWLDGTGKETRITPAAEAMMATLSAAGADGLDADRLASALPAIRKGIVPAEKRNEAEIAFSLAAFLYAHDARGGRLEPSRLSQLLTPKLDIPAPQAVLDQLAATPAQGIGAVLGAYQPPHPGYRALRAELARLRGELERPVLTGSVAGAEGAPHPTGTLPQNWMEGAALLPGKADPRVPMLRLRLGLQASASNIYDDELRGAVHAFQRANGLTPNGRITPKTRAALENALAPKNPSDVKPDAQRLVGQIIANMERWRWLPRDLGKTHVFVNVPDFRMRLITDGAVAFETRVIVGKPETQTPIFSDEMEHLIVNPSWYIPPSILKKEFLPKLASDPDYATRRGYEVIRRGNAVSIRQPPGERNALGHVKFMFPNSHAVYLHDTPNRNLFSAETRAFSHGCVRVQNPFEFAEKITASLGYSERQLRSMVGGGERMIRLQQKIPVHLTYFTLFVDEAGTLQQRRDLYGHDSRIRTALAL
jgi:murein L,D-transpeptidase YcbB/YkuD